MLLRKTKRANGLDGRTDTLSLLLASEMRLAQQLDAARGEAERILRDAEDYARRAEEGCAATIEERTAAAAAASERQLEEALARVQADLESDVKRFEHVDVARDEELVRLVLRALMSDTGAQTEQAG